MNIGSASGGIDTAIASALRGMNSAEKRVDSAARQVASAGTGLGTMGTGSTPGGNSGPGLSPAQSSNIASTRLQSLRGQEDRAEQDPLLAGIIGTMMAQRVHEVNLTVLRRADEMRQDALSILG